MAAGIFNTQGGRYDKPVKIRWDRLMLFALLLTLWSLVLRALV